MSDEEEEEEEDYEEEDEDDYEPEKVTDKEIADYFAEIAEETNDDLDRLYAKDQ